MLKCRNNGDLMYEYELELIKNGCKYIAGVDEVGRGPLVGPVVAACVIMPLNFELEGLNDYKKLSEKKRDLFYDYIINNCLAYSVIEISPAEIDEINIYQASKKAMTLAIEEVFKKIKIDHVLVDAMPLNIDLPSTSIIKGDTKSLTIAAASVLAKVHRDKLMYQLDSEYPHYGFKNHKGYPTKQHLENIKKYGIFKEYRKTYGPVREVINES